MGKSSKRKSKIPSMQALGPTPTRANGSVHRVFLLKFRVYEKRIKFKHEWETQAAPRLGSSGLCQYGIGDFYFEFQDQKSFHVEIRLLGKFRQRKMNPKQDAFCPQRLLT